MDIIYFLTFCAFLSILPIGHTQLTIVVFTDHHKQGTEKEIDISKCTNLPDGVAGQVTSIDTRNKCARFYNGKNCTGESIEVLARSPSHHNLGDGWSFNDRAMSIGPCRDPCDIEVTGGYPNEPPVVVEIFTRPDFKGAYQRIEIQGCALIPVNFIHQTLSVNTNGSCLQLYNNVNCETRGADTIELRYNTPFHNDILRWAFTKAKAISHCGYKCNGTSTTIPNPNITNPQEGEVLLFQEKNFKGNWYKIRLNSYHCLNISHEWEGVAASVKVATCVILYDRRDCKGTSLLVKPSDPDLSKKNFQEIARSVGSCENLISTSHSKGSNSRPAVVGDPELAKSSNSANYATLSPGILAAIIIVPVIGIIISAFLILFIMKRCHPYRSIIEMLSEKEIQEFLSGLGMEMEGGKEGASDDYSVELLAQNKPYNDAYEIPRSKIKYDSKVPLGAGEFGVVYKGAILNEETSNDAEETIPVAIKTVKPSTGVQYLRSLLKEVKVMLYIGKHPNIAHMIGCCTENLRKGEILVLMEYCSNGSLEGFLQKNRHHFKNIVKKGRIDKCQELDRALANGYLRMEDIDPGMGFNFFQLLRWCIEIARGMEFLANSKVIHSDLAARNVLLTDNLQAKISDFGLSRQLYCYSQYVKKHQEPLPWRWLAIESLKNLEFSTKSDVWSWGILSWEIFTLGEKPYPGVVWSNNFIANLEEGLRLVKPKYATTECYNLMIRCWEEDPTLRPTFTEILEELLEINLSSNNADTIVINNSYSNIA